MPIKEHVAQIVLELVDQPASSELVASQEVLEVVRRKRTNAYVSQLVAEVIRRKQTDVFVSQQVLEVVVRRHPYYTDGARGPGFITY